MSKEITMKINYKVSRKEKRLIRKWVKRTRQAIDIWTVTFPDGTQYTFSGRLEYSAWRRFRDWLMFWKRERSMRVLIDGPSPPASSLQEHRRPGRCEQLAGDIASPGMSGGDE